MKNSSKGIARICSLSDVIVLITSAAVLAAKGGVLRKAADLSAVSFEGGFLRDFLNRPGGILEYLGLLLTQAGHFPAAGILLMLVLMVWAAYSCRQIYGHNPFIWVPALCMLVFWTGMDYNLHTMRAVGYAFSQMLGIAAVCSIASLSARSRHPAVVGIISLILLYPPIGGYAVLAALCCAVISLTGRERTGVKSFCLTVLCAAILPQIATRLAYTHTDPTFTYLSGMPYFDFNGNWTRWIPIGASCAGLVLMCAFRKTLAKPVSGFMSFIISVFLSAGLVFFTYKDRNFHAEISMEQAIEANDWDKVLKIAKGLEHPTRIGVMYRNIALLYKGELLERMFTFSDEYSPIDTKAPVSMTMVCAPVSFFYNGMLQFSARWAMECTLLYQPGVQRYKYLAKAALFSGTEKRELVEKYLRRIEQNAGQKRWVKKYRSYLDNPELLSQDPEYLMAKALNEYTEPKFLSSTVVEDTFLWLFPTLDPTPGPLLELSIGYTLIAKDVEYFWPKYEAWVAEGRSLPKAMAEAALMFAYMERDEARLADVLDRTGGDDNPVLKRFNAFSEAMTKSSGSAASLDYFRKRFGDTYWYYCTFVKNFDIN
ncbi:MAG: hypothetical protein KBS72_01290 [Bacteroidales bacterium]|nr:hypothetical protein [Candidatus Cacconaster scatequi]